MTRVRLLVLLLVSCADRKASGPDCATAAAAVAASMTADSEVKWAKPVAEVRATFAAALAKRCTEDKWTAEARKCHANVKTQKDSVACGGELTPAQRNEAKRAVLALLAASLQRDEPAAGSGTAAGSGARGDSAGDRHDDGWLDEDTKLAVVGLEPASGDAEGGTYVVIRGRRFLRDGPRNAKVYFGSRQGTVVRFQSDGELIVQAPGGKAGETVDVLIVFDPGGQMKLPGAFQFVERAP